MAVNRVNDFTITEFVDFEAYRRDTGMLDFRLTELQELSIKAGETKKTFTGKNGRPIGFKKTDKTLSGEGKSGLISAGLMKTQTGGEISFGTQRIRKSEFKKAAGATLVTDAAAVGTPGAEIGYIKTVGVGGTVTATYEQALAADGTHFSYDPETKTVTLPAENGTQVIPDGTKLVYSYTREVNGTRITDPSDKFSEMREVWIHCFGTTACDKEYFAAIYIPRADFSGSFTLDIGGDQTVHDFSFDSAADLCAMEDGKASQLFELIIYSDSED